MGLLGVDRDDAYRYRCQKEIRLASYTRRIRSEDMSEKIPVRTEVGYVDLYLYRPTGEPRAVVFNFHGGGFVLGYWELDAPYCRSLADAAGAYVVNVDYKVAPEYKFPLPYTTTYEALTAFAAGAGARVMGELPVVLGGSSAGANLALGVANLDARGERLLRPAGIYLNYPALRQQIEPRPAIDDARVIAPERLRQYASWAFNSLDELDDPLASPLLAEGVPAPSLLMNIAGYDSLRVEAEAYRDLMVERGVTVDYCCFEGCEHGFTHRDLKEYNEAAANVAWARISSFIQHVGESGR